MSLLDRVAAILDRAGARYAVIGASAMAAHGVARSTYDIDLLTLAIGVSTRCCGRRSRMPAWTCR